MITEVRRLRGRPGWVSVLIEGEGEDAVPLPLPLEEAANLGLGEGETVDGATWKRATDQSAYEEAMHVSLVSLSVRQRSRAELVKRLRKRCIPAAAIDRAHDRLAELGYLDDVAFASAFTRDRVRLRPCGVRRLMADLAGRGVAAGDARQGIEAALAEEEADEAELLDRAASRRAARLGPEWEEADRRRLHAYLTRRGFRGDAVSEWMARNLPPRTRNQENGVAR